MLRLMPKTLHSQNTTQAAANKGNAEIRDIKVVGSGYVEVGDSSYAGGTYYVENLIIENLSATYHVKNNPDLVLSMHICTRV